MGSSWWNFNCFGIEWMLQIKILKYSLYLQKLNILKYWMYWNTQWRHKLKRLQHTSFEEKILKYILGPVCTWYTLGNLLLNNQMYLQTSITCSLLPGLGNLQEVASAPWSQEQSWCPCTGGRGPPFWSCPNVWSGSPLSPFLTRILPEPQLLKFHMMKYHKLRILGGLWWETYS